jgi:hypothetical protein
VVRVPLVSLAGADSPIGAGVFSIKLLTPTVSCLQNQTKEPIPTSTNAAARVVFDLNLEGEESGILSDRLY